MIVVHQVHSRASRTKSDLYMLLGYRFKFEDMLNNVASEITIRMKDLEAGRDDTFVLGNN